LLGTVLMRLSALGTSSKKYRGNLEGSERTTTKMMTELEGLFL